MSKIKTTPLMRERAKEKAAILAKYPVETLRLKDCPDAVREAGDPNYDEAKKVGPLYVLVTHDDTPSNPREDDCHVGTIIGTDGREAVQSDEKQDRRGRSKEWIAEHVNTDPDVYCYATLHRNHRMGDVSMGSPVTGKLDPDLNAYDGVIVAYRHDVREAFGVKQHHEAKPEDTCYTTKMPARKRVLAALKAEVAEYSQWCTGNVYGFRVVDEDGEEIDSCWGFIGEDGDYGEYAMSEGVESAVWSVEKYVKEHGAEESAWLKRRAMLLDALSVLDPDNDPARDMRDEIAASLSKANFKEGWTL